MTGARVVLLGRSEAVKRAVIENLCGGSSSLPVGGRAVAMEHGTISRGEVSISILAVPSKRRFAAVRDVLVDRAIGAVWVRPVGEPADVETERLLRRMTAAGVPYLVFENVRAGAEAPAYDVPDFLPDPLAVVRGDLDLDQVPVIELEEQIFRLLLAHGERKAVTSEL